MSNLRRGREDIWEVRIRRNYHDVIRHLGISERGIEKATLMQAVICAATQKGKNLEEIYKEVANRMSARPEDIKKEIIRALRISNREHKEKYGEAQAPFLRERYLGDKYADITDPYTFIYQIAHYIQTQR